NAHRLGIDQPGVAQREILLMIELDPGAFALENGQHAPDQRGALAVVWQVLHLRVERIILGIAEVGGIRSAAARAGGAALEEEQEILWIRKGREPSPDEDLIGATPDLVLELIVGRSVDVDVDAELSPGPGEKLELQVCRRRRRRGVEAQPQAPAAGVDAVGV